MAPRTTRSKTRPQDFYSSVLPPEERAAFERARLLEGLAEDLALALARVEALATAGRLRPGEARALRRLQAVVAPRLNRRR